MAWRLAFVWDSTDGSSAQVKARYRRGKAALHLGDAPAALEDLGKAAKTGDKASSELFRQALETQRRAVFEEAVRGETGPYELEVLVDAYRVGSDDAAGLGSFLRAAQAAGLLSRDADVADAASLTDFSEPVYDASAVPFLARLRAIRKAVEAQRPPPAPSVDEPWPAEARSAFTERFGEEPLRRADADACLDDANEDVVRAVLAGALAGDNAAFAGALRSLCRKPALAFAAFAALPEGAGRTALVGAVLRGDAVEGALGEAVAAIERDAARARNAVEDAVAALESWACFRPAALDEFGRLESDFDVVAAAYTLKAANALESDPRRLVHATQACFDACRWSFGGRPRTGRRDLVRVALRRAAALAALGEQAAARDALGEAWGGALHLVFRERGDAGDRTALAAEEAEAREALEGLAAPAPEGATPLPDGGLVVQPTVNAPTVTGAVYSSRCVLRRRPPAE